MSIPYPFLAALVMGLRSVPVWNYPGARKLKQIGAIRYRILYLGKCKMVVKRNGGEYTGQGRDAVPQLASR
jgi:helix-turn-helix protein